MLLHRVCSILSFPVSKLASVFLSFDFGGHDQEISTARFTVSWSLVFFGSLELNLTAIWLLNADGIE